MACDSKGRDEMVAGPGHPPGARAPLVTVAGRSQVRAAVSDPHLARPALAHAFEVARPRAAPGALRPGGPGL